MKPFDIWCLVLTALVVGLVVLWQYRVYRQARLERQRAQRALDTVRKISELEELIFKMRMCDPDMWPQSEVAQEVIRQRVELHEWYEEFLGHPLPHDSEYILDLKKSIMTARS